MDDVDTKKMMAAWAASDQQNAVFADNAAPEPPVRAGTAPMVLTTTRTALEEEQQQQQQPRAAGNDEAVPAAVAGVASTQEKNMSDLFEELMLHPPGSEQAKKQHEGGTAESAQEYRYTKEYHDFYYAQHPRDPRLATPLQSHWHTTGKAPQRREGAPRTPSPQAQARGAAGAAQPQAQPQAAANAGKAPHAWRRKDERGESPPHTASAVAAPARGMGGDEAERGPATEFLPKNLLNTPPAAPLGHPTAPSSAAAVPTPGLAPTDGQQPAAVQVAPSAAAAPSVALSNNPISGTHMPYSAYGHARQAPHRGFTFEPVNTSATAAVAAPTIDFPEPLLQQQQRQKSMASANPYAQHHHLVTQQQQQQPMYLPIQQQQPMMAGGGMLPATVPQQQHQQAAAYIPQQPNPAMAYSVATPGSGQGVPDRAAITTQKQQLVVGKAAAGSMPASSDTARQQHRKKGQQQQQREREGQPLPGGAAGQGQGGPMFSVLAPESSAFLHTLREDVLAARGGDRKDEEAVFKGLAEHMYALSVDQDGSRTIQKVLLGGEEPTASSQPASGEGAVGGCFLYTAGSFARIVDECLVQNGAAEHLIADSYGNYVMQRAFERLGALLAAGRSDAKGDGAGQLAHAALADQLGALLSGKLLEYSCHTYACRVVQKALEVLPRAKSAGDTGGSAAAPLGGWGWRLAQELDGHVAACVLDQNGNHVVQKVLEVMPQHSQFIIDAFLGSTESASAGSKDDEDRGSSAKKEKDSIMQLGCHMYGCRVLQRLFECCCPLQKITAAPEEGTSQTGSVDTMPLLRLVLRHLPELVSDRYGNYVVQHGLINAPTAPCTPMEGASTESASEEASSGKTTTMKAEFIRRLGPQVAELSCSKFASNVAEKVIQLSTAAEIESLLDVLLANSIPTPAADPRTSGSLELSASLNRSSSQRGLIAPGAATNGDDFAAAQQQQQQLVMPPSPLNAPSRFASSASLRSDTQQLARLSSDLVRRSSGMVRMMLDPFGNYVAQKLIDAATPQQRLRINQHINAPAPPPPTAGENGQQQDQADHMLQLVVQQRQGALQASNFGRHCVGRLQRFLADPNYTPPQSQSQSHSAGGGGAGEGRGRGGRGGGSGRRGGAGAAGGHRGGGGGGNGQRQYHEQNHFRSDPTAGTLIGGTNNFAAAQLSAALPAQQHTVPTHQAQHSNVAQQQQQMMQPQQPFVVYQPYAQPQPPPQPQAYGQLQPQQLQQQFHVYPPQPPVNGGGSMPFQQQPQQRWR